MQVLGLILILGLSITIHEYAHGWMADKLGDPTPKTAGRLTLNPLAHFDILGTIVLPLLLLLLPGLMPVGYAKPVPINPYHFKNPRKDIMWVGIAGPAINLAAALMFLVLLKTGLPGLIKEFLAAGVTINILLGFFNLLPIPPLDGSRIFASFLPHRLAYKYLKMELAGMFLIFFLFVIGAFRGFIDFTYSVILAASGVNV